MPGPTNRCMVVELQGWPDKTYLPCPPRFDDFTKSVRTWAGFKPETVRARGSNHMSHPTQTGAGTRSRPQVLDLVVASGGGESITQEAYPGLASESTITVKCPASDGSPAAKRQRRNELSSGRSMPSHHPRERPRRIHVQAAHFFRARTRTQVGAR